VWREIEGKDGWGGASDGGKRWGWLPLCLMGRKMAKKRV